MKDIKSLWFILVLALEARIQTSFSSSLEFWLQGRLRDDLVSSLSLSNVILNNLSFSFENEEDR